MTSTVKRKRELGVEARDTRDLRILFAPALIVVVGVGIFPLVFALIVSFQQWEPFLRSHPFNAGANFSEVWNDNVFHTSAINTALFVTVVVPIQTVLGFGLALIVESRVRLQRFFFPVFLLPMLIAPIVVGYMWLQMWQYPMGIINELIAFILPGDPRVHWLGSSQTAYLTLLVTEIWQWTPFVFVIMLAALTAVPITLREAAAVDGAGWWTTVKVVILPTVSPVLTVVVVLRILESANFFPTVWSITQGGPGTSTYSLVMYITRIAQFGRPGVAAAASFIFMLGLAIPIGFILMWLLKRQTAEKRRI